MIVAERQFCHISVHIATSELSWVSYKWQCNQDKFIIALRQCCSLLLGKLSRITIIIRQYTLSLLHVLQFNKSLLYVVRSRNNKVNLTDFKYFALYASSWQKKAYIPFLQHSATDFGVQFFMALFVKAIKKRSPSFCILKLLIYTHFIFTCKRLFAAQSERDKDSIVG